MQPIVQTLEVMAELDLEDDSELLRVLSGQSEQVHALVPDVVGMSVGTVEHDLTLTFAATEAEIAVLDLSPRLLDAPHDDHDVLDEQRWQRLGQATAAAAVSSTLTLPILAGGVVVNSVDLYAGSWDAFTDLHEDIAFVFGAWAPGAVINADLPFHTRHAAEQGPEKLRVSMRINIAVGVIAAARGLHPDAARNVLRDEARRAGLTEADHAALVIRRQTRDDG
ncbi:MAG TPA: hypothetical protein VEW73_06300 [Nocardioides sp.]|nr:hypothetical protein [Nocardioides sp.]